MQLEKNNKKEADVKIEHENCCESNRIISIKSITWILAQAKPCRSGGCI
jgi:hypothetical protein